MFRCSHEAAVDSDIGYCCLLCGAMISETEFIASLTDREFIFSEEKERANV